MVDNIGLQEYGGKTVFPIYQDLDTRSTTGRFICYLHVKKNGVDYRWAVESDTENIPASIIEAAKGPFSAWLEQEKDHNFVFGSESEFNRVTCMVCSEDERHPQHGWAG